MCQNVDFAVLLLHVYRTKNGDTSCLGGSQWWSWSKHWDGERSSLVWAHPLQPSSNPLPLSVLPQGHMAELRHGGRRGQPLQRSTLQNQIDTTWTRVLREQRRDPAMSSLGNSPQLLSIPSVSVQPLTWLPMKPLMGELWWTATWWSTWPWNRTPPKNNIYQVSLDSRHKVNFW